MVIILTYIDTNKIGKIFQSYSLNTSTILDFLITEDNDNFKYLLKLYIIATLEDYKHIQKLTDIIYQKEKFELTPTLEIINKKSSKKFWELIKKRQNNPDQSDKQIWIYNHLQKYIYYLYYSKKPKENLSEQLITSLEKIKQEIIKSYKDKFNSLEGLTEIEDLIEPAFIWIRKKEQKNYHRQNKNEKYKELIFLYLSGTITNEEYKILLKKIESEKKELVIISPWYKETKNNLELYICRIVDYIAIYFDEYYIIDFLKEDLIYTYYMITQIFTSIINQTDNLEVLLFSIRKNMMEYNINSKNHTTDSTNDYIGAQFSNNPLITDFRTNNLDKKTNFFENTADILEIKPAMNELFNRYESIKQIESDEEYAIACYKLSQDFLQIHPYGNGNGRTSKYLFYTLLLKRNILPFTITDDHHLTSCYLNTENNQSKYFYGRNKILNHRLSIQK